MTPFDLDVADCPRAPLTARERLIALVPQLDETDCAILAHQARDFLLARRLLLDQLERATAELRAEPARLVGPERAAFLEKP
jgi:hypothetical protein